MHWKGLRIGGSDGNDSKRRTLIEPQPRHSEQLSRPNPSSTEPASRRSESTPRPPRLIEADETKQAAAPAQSTANDSAKMENPGPSASHSGTPGLRRNRFSFMRLRHASDPQLSRTYAKGEEDVPPVPSLPRMPTPYPVSKLIVTDRVLQHQPSSQPPRPIMKLISRSSRTTIFMSFPSRRIPRKKTSLPPCPEAKLKIQEGDMMARVR